MLKQHKNINKIIIYDDSYHDKIGLSIITKSIITLEDKTEANITLNMYPILELVTLLEIIINKDSQ